MSEARRKKHASPVPPEELPDPPESVSCPTHHQNPRKWHIFRRTEFEKLLTNLEDFEEEVRCHLEDLQKNLGSEEKLSTTSTSHLQEQLEIISSFHVDALRKFGKLAKFCHRTDFLKVTEEADQRYGEGLLLWKKCLQEELYWRTETSEESSEEDEPESPTKISDYWREISQTLEKKIQKLEKSKQEKSRVLLTLEKEPEDQIVQRTGGANPPTELDDACLKKGVDHDRFLQEVDDFIREYDIPCAPLSEEEAEILCEELQQDFETTEPTNHLSSDDVSDISERRQELSEDEVSQDSEKCQEELTKTCESLVSSDEDLDDFLEEMERFIEESNVPYTPMSDEEAEQLYEQLCLEFGIVLPAENLSSDGFPSILETRQVSHEEETTPDVEADVAEPFCRFEISEERSEISGLTEFQNKPPHARQYEPDDFIFDHLLEENVEHLQDQPIHEEENDLNIQDLSSDGAYGIDLSRLRQSILDVINSFGIESDDAEDQSSEVSPTEDRISQSEWELQPPTSPFDIDQEFENPEETVEETLEEILPTDREVYLETPRRGEDYILENGTPNGELACGHQRLQEKSKQEPENSVIQESTYDSRTPKKGPDKVPFSDLIYTSETLESEVDEVTSTEEECQLQENQQEQQTVINVETSADTGSLPSQNVQDDMLPDVHGSARAGIPRQNFANIVLQSQSSSKQMKKRMIRAQQLEVKSRARRPKRIPDQPLRTSHHHQHPQQPKKGPDKSFRRSRKR